jgi:lysophospholipase L1-like esterase
MKRRTAILHCALAVVLPALVFSAPGFAQQPDGERWVATWGTAQELYRQPAPPPPARPAGEAAPPRQGPGPVLVNDQTVRMVVRTSIGGTRARIRLANSFGAPTVVLGAGSVAHRDSGAAIVPGSSREIRFGGERSLVLHPGTVVYSDPIDIEVPVFGDLVVSLYIQGDAGRPTAHPLGLHTTSISPQGDFTERTGFEAERTSMSYYWLAGVDVAAPEEAFAIVAFGNSITDGAVSTPNTDREWPSRFAARLAENEETRHVGVVNAGISGNRVLSDAAGVSVLARLDRDALSYSGVKWIVFMEGINDIGAIARGATQPVVTADRLIWAYQQVIDRAHAQGVKVAGATLTPYEGAGYFSEQGETIRAAVNQWIRTSGEFDAVIDFDAATRDPASPRRFLPAYDPGDHLHPNDAGYQRMADAVDLSIFEAATVAP